MSANRTGWGSWAGISGACTFADMQESLTFEGQKMFGDFGPTSGQLPVIWYLKEQGATGLSTKALFPMATVPGTTATWTWPEVTWQLKCLSFQLTKQDRHQGFFSVNVTQQPSSEGQPTLTFQGEFPYSRKFQNVNVLY